MCRQLLFKKIKYYFLLFTAAILFEHIAVAKLKDTNEFFIFDRVEGEVYYLLPLSEGWRILKNKDRLPIAAILQLPEHAKIEFRRMNKLPTGWVGKEMQFQTKEPINIRLEETMLRTLNNEEFHFANLPSETKEIIAVRKQLTAKNLFLDAWDRVSVFFYGTNHKEAVEIAKSLNKQINEDIDISTRGERITMISPTNNELILAPSFPADYITSWNEAHFKKPFYIYLWKNSKVKGQYLGVTYENYYNIRIPVPGSYFVQIISSDQSALSRPILIHADYFKANKLNFLVSEEVLGSAKIKFPINHQTFLLDKKNRTIDFYYEIDSNKTANFYLNIVEKSKKNYHILLDKQQACKSIILPQGIYNAWIEMEVKEKDKLVVSKLKDSEITFNLLEIENKNPIETLINKKLLSTNLLLDVDF